MKEVKKHALLNDYNRVLTFQTNRTNIRTNIYWNQWNLTRCHVVMSDFYAVLDRWVKDKDRSIIISQVCQYKEGKELFSRPEATLIMYQPIDYWRMFGCETPDLQGLALKILLYQVRSVVLNPTGARASIYILLTEKFLGC